MKKTLLLVYVFTFISYNLLAQLSGTYLIDPNGGGDYTSLTDASTALNEQGMSGNVTLQLAAGIYAEQVLFNITGQSENELLTIESLSGNESDVVFRYEGTTEEENFQIAFQDIKALSLRNISVNTQGLDNGIGIDFKGNCSNVMIDNLHHVGNNNDPAIKAFYSIDFFTPPGILNGFNVVNSYFYLCSPSISIGESLFVEPENGLAKNLSFSNNEFFDADGINLNFAENIDFNNNIAYGEQFRVQPIKLQYCNSPILIQENRIWHSFFSVEISFCDGTENNPILIANNFISGSEDLLKISTNTYLKFAYNSVYSDDDSQLGLITGNTESAFLNNIFYQNHVDGSIFMIYFFEDNSLIDHNNMYSNGSYAIDFDGSAIVHLTYAEYVAQTGREQNGINVQPIFTIPGEDLHTANADLNAATPISEVTTDIDGELRNSSNPTIGADEIGGIIVTSDLTIDTVITSGNVNSGEELTIEWSGFNTGDTDFQAPWIDRVYLSDDENYDNLDLELHDYVVETDLASGLNYERQIIITIPLEIIGTKYVIVKVDAESQLLEDNGNNIATSEAFNISPQALPNLVVTNIEMPDNVFSGTSLQINFTITNQGQAPASGSWVEMAWFEINIEDFNESAYHYKNTPFARANNIIGLMPGESYIGTVTAETPYIGQGYRYIRIETDRWDDVVEELDANDNFSGALIDSVFVNQSPLSDLVIENLQTPAETFAGEEITISYTVLNDGTETTSPVELPFDFYFGYTWAPLFGDWVDYTYFSDSLFDFLPYQYKEVEPRYGNLKVDSSYVVFETIQIPVCVNGPYFITAFVDTWNHVAELDESNNLSVSDPILVIARPGPDLIPLSDDPLENMASNSHQEFSYRIVNQGADTANTKWRDRVFLSDSSNFQYDLDEMIADVIRDISLAPNEQADLFFDLEIPPQMYGQKYLYLWVDAINDVCEQPYDDNNILKIPVNITQSPAADLEISFIPPSGTIIAGDEINLSGIITNIGGIAPDPGLWRDIIFILKENASSDTVYKEVYEQNIPLAPNDSYNLPNPFLIPLEIAPGFYSIGIMTDALNTIWENESEQNNIVFSDPFIISHDSSRVPDLQPIEISSESWISGQTYNINVIAKNTGASTGIATWIDELYVATNTGEKLASAINVFSGDLESDENYDTSFQLEIPLGTPENAFLIAHIDTAKNVAEYNTQNNILTIPISVTPGDAPDLSPTDLVIPAVINAGQELDISLFRNNFGDVDINDKNWIERVVLSQDDLPDNGDYYLKSYAFTPGSLSSQTSELLIDSIQIPLTLTGNYFLIYVMDANDNLNEGENEENNFVVSDVPLQIITPAPVDFSSDLIDLNVNDGDLDNMQYTITNIGNNTFTGKFYDVYFLSTDSIYSLDDQLLGWDQVADFSVPGNQITLDPSESSNRLAYFFYIPVIADEYYVIQKIDAFLNVYETDESNNTIVYGPVSLDNVEEIFPDIVYNKQFGRNYFQPNSINNIFNQGNNPVLGPDRHDYKITIPDGFGMITHMWENESANEAYGINNESQPIYEMYIGEEFIPTPLVFDFLFDSPLQAEQYILVPVADNRIDYIKTMAPYIPPHYNPDSMPISQYFLQAEFKEFSVFSLHPEKVGTAHNVTLRIDGFDLEDTLGLDVALFHQLDTVYAFETYPQNSSELIAYIDMREYEPGEYQLLVRKRSTGDYTIWEETVEVFEDDGADFYLDVLVPSESRLPNDFIVNVDFGNAGYANEYDMELYVAFFFLDSTASNPTTSTGLNIEYLGSSIPGEALNGFISTELNPAGVIDYGDLGYAVVFAIRIPIMHARFEESLTFKVTPDTTGVLVTQVTLDMIRRSPYTFTGRIADAGSSHYAIMQGLAIAETDGALAILGGNKAKSCKQVLDADNMTKRLAKETFKVAEKARGSTSYLTDLRNNWKGVKDFADPKTIHDSYKGLINQKGQLSLTADENTPFNSEIDDIFGCISTGVTTKPTGSTCIKIKSWTHEGVKYKIKYDRCKRSTKKKGKTGIFAAFDPNEIVGPEGEGPNRLIVNDQTFSYTVYFENVPEATAPAARVRIDNPLDSNLRLQSLRIVSFGFSDTSFQFGNAPFVQQTFDLGEEFSGQQLQIIGGTNPESNKAFFEFITIDEQTQSIVTGANQGFLLPNDSTGRGQGYITYMIDPKTDLEPGTIIKNKAAIIFDENEVIETNTWSNIISHGELKSKINELPEFSNPEFDLSWTNETPPFGPLINSFDIYVREPDLKADWFKWLGGTKSLKKQFTGIPGHTYEFFSRAKSENNYEPVEESADATTTILEFSGDFSNGDPILYPNPASDKTQLVYNSTGSDIPIRIEITDLYGKKTHSVTYTTTGTGLLFISIPIYNLSAGIYVVGIYEHDDLKGSTKLMVTGNPAE